MNTEVEPTSPHSAVAEQRQALFGGAISDWRLGPDGEGEGRSFFQKLHWDVHPAELLLPYGLCALGAVAIVVYGRHINIGWTLQQYAAAAFLTVNLGFAVAIGTTPIKRYFHREGDIRGAKLATMVLEASAQFFFFNWMFVEVPVAGLTYGYALTLSAMVTGSAFLVLFSPLFIRRAVAHAAFMLTAIGTIYLLPVIPGMEWYPVVVLYKYISSHMPREEPYRPSV